MSQLAEVAYYIDMRVEDDPEAAGEDRIEQCSSCGMATWVTPASFAEAQKRGKVVKIVCVVCAGRAP